MFKQQVIGVITLALPTIILFQLFPHFVFSLAGVAAISLINGVYVGAANRKIAQRIATSFLYKPSGEYRDYFQTLVRACDVNPDDISIHYAYANEAIAMAMFNTIVLDPVVWSSTDGDPQALKVLEVYDTAIEPELSSLQKARLRATRRILTPGAQRFLFKHELGHIMYNFSYKKIIVAGIIAAVATALSIYTASRLMASVGGIGAVLGALCIGVLTDILFSYASNIFFKSREEEKADMFAAFYSTLEDIEEAADFFENHQTILDTYRSPGLLSGLPSMITSGHPDGKARAGMLRNLY